jgi:general secretion pathway protein E
VRIRLSTLPVQFGETCVLRLLPAKDEGGTLSDLQFSPKILAELRRIFAMPQGLFLITGPTGSGKTTTLYAGLREIIGKKINVTTIEDPVEYCLSGANQVQVNEKCGFTFAAALRSILRQDPDVILVGEIRDEETARIALRAAQTGHLVLATLHTNSAMGATARLQDLGISKASLQDSLLGVVAQRLLRKKAGGRIATLELLRPDGTYVDGTLRQYADRLVQNGLVERDELLRVLGN